MKQLIVTFLLMLLSLITYAQSELDSLKRDRFEYFSIADTNYHLYKLPDNFTKPKNWKNADIGRTNYSGDLYGNTYSDTFDLNDALAIIDTATLLSRVGSAKSWCIKNYEQAFPYLVARLSNKQKIGLKNTTDLIIWDRIETGDLKFYGHGGGIEEDIFTIAGRASWILNQLTGESFAIVHGNLTQKEAEKFKKLWLAYINKLK